MRCAQVLNGVVVNVIEADPASFAPGDGSLIVASDTAQIGDSYANGAFTPATPSPTYQTAGLSFLQFMALFTPAEQEAIVSASDPQVKVFVLMAAGAGALDLGNSEVAGGVAYLQQAGLLQPARAARVLTGAPPA
jgi:hypothetical protein